MRCDDIPWDVVADFVGTRMGYLGCAGRALLWKMWQWVTDVRLAWRLSAFCASRRRLTNGPVEPRDCRAGRLPQRMGMTDECEQEEPSPLLTPLSVPSGTSLPNPSPLYPSRGDSSLSGVKRRGVRVNCPWQGRHSTASPYFRVRGDEGTARCWNNTHKLSAESRKERHPQDIERTEKTKTKE